MKNDNQIVIKPETIKASAPIKLLLCNKLMAVLWLRSKKSNYIQWKSVIFVFWNFADNFAVANAVIIFQKQGTVYQSLFLRFPKQYISQNNLTIASRFYGGKS